MNPSDTRESIIARRNYRENIKGDKFSLYISSYPVAIDYLVKRIGDSEKVVVELCCGVGIALEGLASGFARVIGVDSDKTILDVCAENLKEAGEAEKATLILGNINDNDVLKQIKADVVVYDIPFWSAHENIGSGDLTAKNPSLRTIVERIRKSISEDIVIFCSPDYSYEIIEQELGPCEFQKVFINGKHDRNYVYLGNLKQVDPVTEIRLFI